jgi:methyl-accepting chemotaxis protein
MLVGLLRRFKSNTALAEVASTAPDPAPSKVPPPDPSAADSPSLPDQSRHDSALEIIDLLELDLMAMIRHVERAADAVKQGAESTAQTLHGIRGRSNALSEQTRSAKRTADAFAHISEEFTQSSHDITDQVRNAGALADKANMAAEEASDNIDRLCESIASIGGVVDLISAIARQTSLLALNSTIEAARAGAAGRGFAVVASEVKALAMQTQQATEDIRGKIETLQQNATLSVGAMLRISESIEAIRPVFAKVHGAVELQNTATGEVTRSASETVQFISSVNDSAAEIESATEDADKHGRKVGEAGQAVATFAEKLKSRCAVLLHQHEFGDRRQHERLPCHLDVEIHGKGKTGPLKAYDISFGGMLLAGPGMEELPLHQDMSANVADIGVCTLRAINQSQIGVQTEFVSPGDAIHRAVEEKIWMIREENSEFVSRAMDAGQKITQIFNDAVTRGEISKASLFDTDYEPISGTDPVQYRTRFLDWSERALTGINEAFGTGDARLVFSAIVDRNGYLPVHKKIFSQPQRPGEPAWNAANSRNRRIFDDRAGLAAARSIKTYLIQSYPRDMGNGVTVMMREIDVPIRVQGTHWGALRTAYKL